RNPEQRIVGLHRTVTTLVRILITFALTERGIDHLRQRLTHRRGHDLVQRVGDGGVVAAVRGVEGKALHTTRHAKNALAVHVPFGRTFVGKTAAGGITDADAAQARTGVGVDAIGVGADHV